jgi:GNAT superfamily N-acetyltransferase
MAVAFQGASIFEIGSDSLDGGTVRSVFVYPAYKRLDVGYRLIAAIESTAAQSGLCLLRVPSPITAKGFYFAVGFLRFGRASR